MRLQLWTEGPRHTSEPGPHRPTCAMQDESPENPWDGCHLFDRSFPMPLHGSSPGRWTPVATMPSGPPYPPQGPAYWSDVAQDIPGKVPLPGLG